MCHRPVDGVDMPPGQAYTGPALTSGQYACVVVMSRLLRLVHLVPSACLAALCPAHIPSCTAWKLHFLAVGILANLTYPVECLTHVPTHRTGFLSQDQTSQPTASPARAERTGNHRDKQRVHAPPNGIIRPNQNPTKLDDDQ